MTTPVDKPAWREEISQDPFPRQELQGRNDC